MTIVAMIPNLNASVDWWTTVQAARDFWLAFAGIAITIWAVAALRSREHASTHRR